MIPVGAGVPGVTKQNIYVGIWTLNSQAVNAAESSLTGNPNNVVNPNTDYAKAAQAVLDYLNAHGGAAGRKLVGVYHQLNVANLTSQSGRDQEAQAACTDWTQDHHVFAMMEIPGGGQSFNCALSTHTVLLSDQFAGGQGVLDAALFQKYHDLWYAPNSLLDERREGDLVDALAHQGYFSKGARVAVMVEDQPGSRAGVANGLRPALARNGVKLVLQINYPDIVASNWTSYILQLQQAGVTHVIMSGTSGGYWSTLLMMKAAANAGYAPHWGIGSDNQPAAVAQLGGSAISTELAHTQGMGWMPAYDVGDPSAQSINTATCKKLEQTSGQGVVVATYCEDFMFLQSALSHASVVSPAGLSQALNALGSGYPSVFTNRGKTNFAADIHDGPTVQRDFGYDPRCGSSGNSCFLYTGPARAMP